MKIFLDTSSLIKLYHREVDTEELENIFSAIEITEIFLSEIAKVEFASTIWKKVRTNEIAFIEAKTTLDLFEADFAKYTFAATNTIIIEQARILVSKYGLSGLRTLDSLQLSTSLSLSQDADLFLTSDKLLRSLIEAEGLPTHLPVK